MYKTIHKKNLERGRIRERDEASKRVEATRKEAIPKWTNKDSEVRCYNCRVKGHKSRDYKKRKLGKKCFKCQKFRHTANQCNTVEDKVDKKILIQSLCHQQISCLKI